MAETERTYIYANEEEICLNCPLPRCGKWSCQRFAEERKKLIEYNKKNNTTKKEKRNRPT